MAQVRHRRTRAEYEAIPDGFKLCSRCSEILPSQDFHGSDESKKTGICRECRKSDREHYNLRDSVLMTKYGVREIDYLKLLLKQEFRCAICPATPEEQRFGVLEVDHDHVTGQVRGLLCHPCNIALGKMEDDPERLLAAAGYLMAHRMTEETIPSFLKEEQK